MSASGCYSSGIAAAGSHLARLQLYPNHACASIFSWRDVPPTVGATPTPRQRG